MIFLQVSLFAVVITGCAIAAALTIHWGFGFLAIPCLFVLIVNSYRVLSEIKREGR